MGDENIIKTGSLWAMAISVLGFFGINAFSKYKESQEQQIATVNGATTNGAAMPNAANSEAVKDNVKDTPEEVLETNVKTEITDEVKNQAVEAVKSSNGESYVNPDETGKSAEVKTTVKR